MVMRTHVKIKLLAYGTMMLAAVIVPRAHAETWTDVEGYYAGIHGGYGFAKIDSDVRGGATNVSPSAHPDHGFGGFHLGYGQVFNRNYYLAAEFNMGIWAGTDSESDVTIDVSGTATPATFSAELQRDFSIYARFGYLLEEERGLLYGLLGWNHMIQTVSLATATAAAASDFGINSFTYGAGYQRRVADNVSLRLQYRYIDYGSNNDSLSLENIGAGLRLRAGANSSNHIFSLGMSYIF